MKLPISKVKKWLNHSITGPILFKLWMPLAKATATCIEMIPGNPYHDIFYRHGYHLLRKHFYIPIPDKEDLPADYWERHSDLVGIDMNDLCAVEHLNCIFPLYLDEFRAIFPNERTKDTRKFYLINGGYMAIDAHVYYAMIRHYKPKRIIEIGAGNSTLLAGAACLENYKETGKSVDYCAIDPYPQSIIDKGVPGLTRLITSKVQDIDMDYFTSLEENDILFIDSSHVLRSGNDVEYEYMEILPRLVPGVLVHIHDISLPKSYPRVYFDNQLYWNEQFLLQAFLTFNSRFKVIWAGNYMIINYPDQVCSVFPEYSLMRQHYPMSEPSAFWMRS
jgi:hypothetical protein